MLRDFCQTETRSEDERTGGRKHEERESEGGERDGWATMGGRL
jgi:hypothetical protein